ncbi:hypothetical protein MMPV_002159 [Pyropia vietnamensis]
MSGCPPAAAATSDVVAPTAGDNVDAVRRRERAARKAERAAIRASREAKRAAKRARHGRDGDGNSPLAPPKSPSRPSARLRQDERPGDARGSSPQPPLRRPPVPAAPAVPVVAAAAVRAAPAPGPPLSTTPSVGASTPLEAPAPKEPAFVWRKKVESLRKRGIERTPAEEAAHHAEVVAELARAKARRAEREAERAEAEEAASAAAREAEQAAHAGATAAEAAFGVAQHYARQAIRLRSRRPSRLDAMARNVRTDLVDVPPAAEPPYRLLRGGGGGGGRGGDPEPLSVAELEDIHVGVLEEQAAAPSFYGEPPPAEEEGGRVAVDRSVPPLDLRMTYWRCLEVLTVDALADARAREAQLAGGDGEGEPGSDGGVGGGGGGSVPPALAAELARLLDGKTGEELAEREAVLRAKVDSAVDGDAGDMAFWRLALRRLRSKRAATTLDGLHAQLLAIKLERLPDEEEEVQSADETDEAAGSAGGGAEPLEVIYGSGSGRVHGGRGGKVKASSIGAHWADAPGGRGGEAGEAFADEVAVAPRRAARAFDADGRPIFFAWNDKYRPRKPRFYNRVHTGYEWNKYNRTHYDHDNPPPKTVEGYKFNIFYPDLVDPSVTPTYKLSAVGGGSSGGANGPGASDVCVLTFSAGPPYEDIAFKIVNREWEHSHRRGFRCSFERGILHLWFNFRRLRYRR